MENNKLTSGKVIIIILLSLFILILTFISTRFFIAISFGIYGTSGIKGGEFVFLLLFMIIIITPYFIFSFIKNKIHKKSGNILGFIFYLLSAILLLITVLGDYQEDYLVAVGIIYFPILSFICIKYYNSLKDNSLEKTENNK